MEFFDKLGKKATEAYKVTADKTGKIAKETKIKFKIGDLKAQINSIYEEIGKKVYQKHIREEDICIKKDLEEECTKIDVLSDEIETLLRQCLELKDKKQCPNCYKELEKDDNYCSNCGEKQTEKDTREEALEELKNIEVSEDNVMEKQIVIDEIEQDKAQKNDASRYGTDEEKTNLEKTVEVESDVSLEGTNNNNNNENLEKTVQIESDVDIEENE